MSAPMLVASGLTRRFGGVAAVNDVSLQLDPGDLRCIIGPNGAGKSTLFNMLAGTLKPSGGKIRFDGRDMVGVPVHLFVRLGIVRKFQVPALFESMTVEENLAVADRSTRGAAERRDRVSHMLVTLGLARQAGTRAGVLSHGEKQWLEIGMTLIADPKLLLLDEPTAGMTAEETRRTATLLRDIGGDVTVVVIEHDVRFVRDLACRTTVMHQGRIIADGPFAAIEADDLVRDVYLGRQ